MVAGVTWREVAALYPGFVQWIVAIHGPLPDGEVTIADYERYREEYESVTR